MDLAENSLSNLYKYKEMEKEQIYQLFLDTLKGLQLLDYQKIIHRDIKPDNILQISGNKFRIADFGTSR